MFLGCGVGAYAGGIFHLATHAFFKALLFLGCGSVIHGLSGEQDLRKMGGLRALMPITAATFFLASLANAGIFPLAGFWSKDEILLDAAKLHPDIFILLAIAAFFTAFYMGRQIFMVFFGEPRTEAARQAKESPLVMTIPLIVLAGLSAVGGFINLPVRGLHFFSEWLSNSLGDEAAHAAAGAGAARRTGPGAAL